MIWVYISNITHITDPLWVIMPLIPNSRTIEHWFTKGPNTNIGLPAYGEGRKVGMVGYVREGGR
jgi:hypothetical protein